MTNKTLQQNVIDELSWDPMIDSAGIAVSAHDDGTITLRGTVGSFREKHEAPRIAKRVSGVTNVDDQLDVRLLTGHRRHDAQLRGDVLQALLLDAQVPDTIDARVKDAVVTLTGTAQWRYQRIEAEFVAGNVPGVVNVHNDIAMFKTWSPRRAISTSRSPRPWNATPGLMPTTSRSAAVTATSGSPAACAPGPSATPLSSPPGQLPASPTSVIAWRLITELNFRRRRGMFHVFVCI